MNGRPDQCQHLIYSPSLKWCYVWIKCFISSTKLLTWTMNLLTWADHLCTRNLHSSFTFLSNSLSTLDTFVDIKALMKALSVNKMLPRVDKHAPHVFKNVLGAVCHYNHERYIDGLAQDCCNSSALALELLQSCAKPSICASSRFKSLETPQVVLFSSSFRMTTNKTQNIRITGPFVRGIHRWPMDSLHKGPMMQKSFPYHDVIIWHIPCRRFR